MASTPQDFTSGQVLTDTNMDKLPQGIMALASSTSNVGPTSSTTELDIITAAAVTPLQSNRRFRLRFHTRGITGTVANDVFIMRIKEGSTVLNESHHIPPAASTSANGGTDFEAIVDSPTVAAHTYKVTIQRNSGTGTATITGTATAPILFYVEDAGQA